MSGCAAALMPSETILRASMSSPESVSSSSAKRGLQHEHLEDLEPLLLAAGEAVVEVAAGEARVHLEVRHARQQLLAELAHRHLRAPRRA